MLSWECLRDIHVWFYTWTFNRSSEAVEVIWAKVCRMGRVLAKGQDLEQYQQLRNRRRKRKLGRSQGGIVRELFIKMGLVQCFRNQRYKKMLNGEFQGYLKSQVSREKQ